jgi:NAD(P)-dependent dehydrogenase (short-subunit alcohol dehydrogenase family)
MAVSTILPVAVLRDARKGALLRTRSNGAGDADAGQTRRPGIGLQIAKDIVAHGLTVLVGSRNLERGEAVAKEVGPDAHALQLDVTDAT